MFYPYHHKVLCSLSPILLFFQSDRNRMLWYFTILPRAWPIPTGRIYFTLTWSHQTSIVTVSNRYSIIKSRRYTIALGHSRGIQISSAIREAKCGNPLFRVTNYATLVAKKRPFSIVLRLFATFMQIASKNVLQLDIRFLALVLSFRVMFTSIKSHLCRVWSPYD